MQLRLGVVLGCLLASTVASAVELKNDGYLPGQNARFQAGFVVGEMGAVRLTSPFSQSRVQQVQFLYDGLTDAGTQTVTLRVWDDTALGVSPGAELYMGDFQVTASDTAFQSIDLSLDNVLVPSSFRVGVEFQHAGLPSIAIDDDGTIAGSKNFIFAMTAGWLGAPTLGLTGDFIIRAVVSEVGDAGTPDAGTPPPDAGAPDAGTPPPDAGAPDAGTPPPDAGAPPDAGIPAGCASNAECAVGSYCDPTTARCTFDCRTDLDCGGKNTCSSLGRCVAPEATGCGCTSTAALPGLLLGLLALGRRRAWGTPGQ